MYPDNFNDYNISTINILVFIANNLDNLALTGTLAPIGTPAPSFRWPFVMSLVLAPGPSVQWSVCEGRVGGRVHIWNPMDKGLTAQGWLGSVHHPKDDVLQLKQLLDILLLETCWPTDDNYQKIAIHIRFKLPSRKMYFIVHFSFDTHTFGFQYSSNMENNKKV